MKIPPLLTWIRQESRGREWLASLPDMLAACAERWELTIGEPFDASQVSYAVPATTAAGERVVLKVQFPDRESAHEAEALQVYAGRGHVRLLGHAPELHALLIEKCEPGTSLGQASAATIEAVTFGILERLWPTTGTFPRLKDEAELWEQELEEGRRSSEADAVLLGQASEVLESLARTEGELALVNRDLHRDNVLQSTREPWLVIDPKPLIAEREFALANRLPMFGGTEIEEAGPDVIDRLNALAAKLRLDAHRARGWAFVRSVSWAVDGGGLAPHFWRVAGVLGKSLRGADGRA